MVGTFWIVQVIVPTTLTNRVSWAQQGTKFYTKKSDDALQVYVIYGLRFTHHVSVLNYLHWLMQVRMILYYIHANVNHLYLHVHGNNV